MQVQDLFLSGIKKITPQIFRDERGYFFESFKKSFLQEFGITTEYAQENTSFSQKNTLRGMHFQTSPGQDKWIHVSQGKILDVVVDIRPESSTFTQFLSVILEDKDPSFLYVPKGFAHGFLVLSDFALVHYKVSTPYNPATEKGFHYQTLPIPWPVKNPLLSQRDQNAPSFSQVLAEGLIC